MKAKQKTAVTATEKRVRKNKPVRNIDPELHKAWKKSKRRGDPEVMAKELELSRPVIDKALIYGNVSKTEIADRISAWFSKRLEKEKEKTAKAIEKLS